MQLPRIFLLFGCCFLTLTLVTGQDRPFFNLPVQLIGFPVIIASVRITNFLKKLAYALNPDTYVRRMKRAHPLIHDEEILDVGEVEKKLVAELGNNVCIYEKICVKYAERTLQRRSWERVLNWNEVFRCMDKLAIDLYVQNNDRSLIARRTSQTDPSAYEENSYGFPYGNIILNLFNNAQILSEYHDFPLDSTTGNYQLDTLNDRFNQFGGFGANLFNALSSISRYDDLKCVPRILCEIASGKPPGEYKRASIENNEQYFADFGRNAFTQWLTGLAETSPILSFARAAVLGYSNRNPAMCYRTFPKCPRNPDKLVHYLNNYNGGFFRFFSKVGHGSYSQLSYAQDNSEFLRERKRKTLPPGIAGAETDRTGTGKLKFDVPILTARQDYGRSFFPRENTLENSRRVVFIEHEESSDRPLNNRVLKSLSDLRDSDVNILSQDSPLVFPQESDEGVRVLRFTSESPNSVSHSAFRFPRQ